MRIIAFECYDGTRWGMLEEQFNKIVEYLRVGNRALAIQCLKNEFNISLEAAKTLSINLQLDILRQE
jgi:hypothetical protein